MAEKPIIEVQGLTKRFKGLTAVHDVSFSVEKGSITGMIGPNGAGKSTTFNMICGYYPPTEGKIFYNGEDITNKKAYEYTNMKIARTFQIMKPLKNLSVLDNVTAAAYFGHAGAKSEKEAKERAMEVLHFTGLYEKRHDLQGHGHAGPEASGDGPRSGHQARSAVSGREHGRLEPG